MIERDRRDALDAVIGEQVLDALGAPRDLLQVQIRRLWDGRYRVNILIGADITCARVAHSYFVVTDADGIIATSTPAISKRY